MARIFLSHAKADRVRVRRMAEALRRAGHEPWIAEDEVRAGEPIPAAIVRGLRSTDHVVACLSREAVESGWVAGELDLFVLRAFDDRMGRVLPVRLDSVEPPALIRHLPVLDLFPEGESFERGINDLLRIIDQRKRYLGLLTEIRSVLEHLLANIERVSGSDAPGIPKLLSMLATVLRELNHNDEARLVLERSLAITEKLHDPDDPRTLDQIPTLIQLLIKQGRLAEARPLLERALPAFERNNRPARAAR